MENGRDMSFKPTVEWMARKYEEMNKRLFLGELGFCDFGIFTSGKGSEGKTLGLFKMSNRVLKAERSSRRMFVENWYTHERVYISKDNFVDYCSPRIELNGNYTGTEESFTMTLVHEMCHYYTYMYGYAPRQGHGTEFKNIASWVADRSNGEFNIQRLATAEEMAGYKLSDEMQAKRDKRLATKKSSITVLFRFMVNGQIEMSNTSSKSLIDAIVNSYKDDKVKKVSVSNDDNLIDFLFSKGYKKNFRTWRYWNVEQKEWSKELGNYEMEDYVNPKYNNETPMEKPVEQKPRQMFSIKTSNGVFQCEFDGNYDTLRMNIKNKFPNMRDEVIDKIMSNSNNFKVMENKKTVKAIVSETIEEYLQNKMMDEDDVISITPDMNLGLHSPFEFE